MSRNVWHKRYHGDALNGYMGLTLEQRGAYTTLLDLMYDTDWEVGIRDRERWIAGHLNVSVRRWKTLRDDLLAAGKIDIFDGCISNFRYRKERESALSLSRKRSESGASGGEKSGEVRRNSSKNNNRDEANASDLPPYARATESDTDTEDNKTSVLSSKRGRSPRIEKPPQVDEQVWTDFIKLRQAKRAPLTQTALNRIAGEVDKVRRHGFTLNDALAMCCERGWQGFKAEWLERNGNGGNYRNGSGAGGRVDGFANALDRAEAHFDANDDG